MAETHEVAAPESAGAADEPLSIGEVLAVLAEEFPDVTISKIRFLESQGLVEPERNASGYRQFRDADIERLRWILRQQRDHFLPLKVIRRALERGVDVIDAGAGDQPTLWTAVAEAAAAEEVERKRVETVESEAADARRAAAVSSAHPTRARVATPVGSGSVRRRRKDGDEAARYETPADVVAALQEAPQGLDASTSEVSDDAEPPTSESEPVGVSSGDGVDATSPASGEAQGSDSPDEATGPADGESDAVPAEDPPVDHGYGPATSGPEAHVSDAGPDTEGAMRQLSRDELMEQVGLDEDTLDQLTEFGLLDPVDVAGEALYGSRDIEIARLAKRGSELGLTPRHLRIYKVAADREAGLLEQVAMPLLKQRNPAARERAATTVAELADLGASLHAALLAEELGPNLAP